jgi:hypothetical protein
LVACAWPPNSTLKACVLLYAQWLVRDTKLLAWRIDAICSLADCQCC